MPEPPTPDTTEALKLRNAAGAEAFRAWIKDPELGERRQNRLVIYAYNLTHDIAKARDLVQEAILRLSDGRRSWRPDLPEERRRNLVTSVINSLLSNERTKASARYERMFTESLSKRVESGEPSAIELLVSFQDHAAEAIWIERLRETARARKDPELLVKIIDLADDDVAAIDDVVAATGRSREEIERARERLRHLVRENLPADHPYRSGKRFGRVMPTAPTGADAPTEELDS